MNLKQEYFEFERAEVYKVSIPLPRPFYDSTMGPFNDCPCNKWLILYDNQGFSGETPCSDLMEKEILPLINKGKRTYQEWYNYLYWQIRNNGFKSLSAVELGRFDLALHDIMAKRAGLPLHRFWGAQRDWAKIYASGGGTNLKEDELITEISGFAKDCYDTIKMKVAKNFGSELETDIKRIALVRKIIGPDIKLAVDANQCLNVKEALNFAKRIADYNIAWFEEPVHSADLRSMKELVEKCPIPISMGESERNFYGLRELVNNGITHLQPVPSNLSSIKDWMDTRDLAANNKLTFSSGGFSPITASYIATASDEAMTEYLFSVIKPFTDMMKKAPEIRNGCFYLPLEPGLPVQPDWQKLRDKNYLHNIYYYYFN